MREQKAVAAVVRDDRGRFLVTFNARWNGYAFPMVAVPQGGDTLGSVAVRAVEEDLGSKLPNATAAELDYIGEYGVSGGTGEETLYEYWLHEVTPNQTLDLANAPEWNGNQPMFLTYAELTSRTDLTWSTPAVARVFVESQEAVLAVVSRAGEKEAEFLVVHNAGYGGDFFPTRRVKTEVKPDRSALAVVRSDLGYTGAAEATRVGEVADVHFSNRFGLDRRYLFHICDVRFPGLDLHRPGNPLEQALKRRNKAFRWLPAGALAGTAVPFSPTMPAVAGSVAAAVPPRTHGPLRQSAGGLALITRTAGGRRKWLAQWNEAWGAFAFVGGHPEGGETFRECVVREIEEELGLTAADCPVAATRKTRQEFKAESRGAGLLTAYVFELFCAHPTAAGLKTIADNPLNAWLDEDEIRNREAHDARPVSETMATVLDLAGWPGCP